MLAPTSSKSAKVANKVSPEVQKLPPTQAQRERIVALLDGRGLNIALGVMTIFALFADDMRIGGFTTEADSAFYVLLLLVFVGFSLEMVANVYARPGYFNRGVSFTFWMDLISTLSILSDVEWVMNLIVPEDTNTKGLASTSLQAGKAGRAGTKAGRMVKLIRLIRLIRVSRMFRSKEDSKVVQLNEPSKVGRILTELTTRRLIVLVLTMIIFLPVIDMSLSSVDEYQYDAFFYLHRLAQDYNATGSVTMAAFQSSFQEYIRQCDGLILSVVVYGVSTNLTNEWMHQMQFQGLTSTGAVDTTSAYALSANPTSGWSASYLNMDLSTLRKTDLDTTSSIYACYANDGTVFDTSCFSGVVFDIQSQNVADAHSNVGKTCIIIFVFGMSIYFFTKDSDQLMALVNRLAQNPLANVEIEEDLNQEYETRMLEKTIAKIGRLLQVGFGSAGTEIISKNMSGTGELNVMIPGALSLSLILSLNHVAGKKISSIFGFGIIEHFTETVSVLEESVITYINTLADIVHSDANMYYGAANKNIGSAFLIAWKICDGSLPGMRDPRDPATKPIMDAAERVKKRADIGVLLTATGSRPRKISPQELVDSALVAVLRMRVEIHTANQPNGRFHTYLTNQALQDKFDNHFHVAMGFGLHIGWAIEGAIGSKFKIDASYLSPNVNMAARLENATGQFQCDMLISEWFMDEVSPIVKSFCRKVDRVTVKGSEIPMDLWTFDIGNYVDIPLPLVDPNGVQMPMDFERQNFLQVLQERIPRDFFTLFNDGMTQYLDGHWDLAHTAFTAAYAKYPDGPTDVLLKTLARENSDTNGGYAAPAWWKGFRPLTEK
ncbi:hypothetical protein DYB37_000240 [Aphanomyces astaci]|uniref:Guanylate cyclase domain-containing protein n=2 Tax=Aphanomyces astaci TaxID=112090 RepID=A0A3R7A9K8_APHAT|nr:hypothetical protein DYB37_000240 [Aphanomyces astaci]RHZ29366.1 hypothetical protein DYB26_000785 [Aphanomyces astaci]